MKTSKRFLAVLLSLLMIVSLMLVGITSTSAASASISYTYAQSKAGYAEGTITLTPTAGNYGKYYLFWADDTDALEGYRPIDVLNITSGSGTVKMPPQTVIPPDATKIIAFLSNTDISSNTTILRVSDAEAVYSIPESRQLSFNTDDALYTFGAISDPQLANDSYGSGKYPNDEDHLTDTLNSFASRRVDFIVSSGDTVNDQNGKQTYAAEYKRYQQILAESFYSKPIYEALGNHDVGTVWDKNGNYYNDNAPFIKATGLDSKAETINAGKPYFEVTEPTTGDHFIFMALEGGFYTNKGTQFSTAQLDWLEGLLKKYSTDGKNIFIIEHANIEGWGSGDKLTAPYYYDLGLNKNSADVKRFISLMETYKECVIITGHTHLELSAQYNYSDNNGTSAVMMHNSAIGGVRRLINGTVDRTPVSGLSEGYLVEVYEDCILFNGMNTCADRIMPQCSYIIPFDTEAIDKPTEPATSEPVTTTEVSTTTEPVEITTAPTDPTETSTAPTDPTEPATKETEPVTTEKTEPSTSAPVTTETEPVSTAPYDYTYGDADLDGTVTIKDATLIQKYSAQLEDLEGVAFTQANVSGDAAVNVRDATYIQKFIAGLLTSFPVENEDEFAQTGAIAPEYELAGKYLDTYYMYSSYNQYMALKEACSGYIGDNPYRPLEELEKELEDFILSIGGKLLDLDSTVNDEITVYFTNNYNWSSVKAYVWGSGGKKAEWPGETMTYAKTNSQSQKIYSITFSYADYQNIIFTDGSKQTTDISLSGDDGIGYYISGESSGKYTCSTYTYA